MDDSTIRRHAEDEINRVLNKVRNAIEGEHNLLAVAVLSMALHQLQSSTLAHSRAIHEENQQPR